MLSPLPIDAILGDLVATMGARGQVVLEAPPGAGKTTRVPRALLDAGFAEKGEIWVLEPRRLAARMAAGRVASELGEPLGQTIGYQVRFEDVSSAKTRVRFVTEGILTRRLARDRRLAGIACVVLDEFHERHLHADVALALCHRLRGERSDLGLVVMSATLETGPVAEFLGADVHRSMGRMFDVTTEFTDKPDDRALELQVAGAVRRILSEEPDGDVLVFLPGSAEIRRAETACGPVASAHDAEVAVLHGDLSVQEQDRAVRRGGRRKIILSTNVAESSVTIEGIVGVVDSGLVRSAHYSPWSGAVELRTTKASRASCIQRQGRAGRLRAGRCIRLYSRHDFEARPAYDVPEIRRAELAQVALELRSAGIESLAWFDPPKPETWTAALDLLTRLGALDSKGAVTPLGHVLQSMPLHPRLARIVAEGDARGIGAEAARVAAILGERDIRREERVSFGQGTRARNAATEASDVCALLDLYDEVDSRGHSADAIRRLDLDGRAVQSVRRAVDALRRRSSKGTKPPPPSPAAHEAALLQSILAGFPDKVARRLSPGGKSLAMAGGGLAELSDKSLVHHAPFMVVVDATVRPNGTVLARLASAIEPEWLIDVAPERIEEKVDLVWNESSERVDCTARMTMDGLVLSEAPAGRGEAGAIAAFLAERAERKGFATFAPDGSLEAWVARARFARDVEPELCPVDDGLFRRALLAMCEGRRSFADLRGTSLMDVAKTLMPDGDVRRIDRLAPARITLPSGRTAEIHYESGKPPHVESFLQDFFGTPKTPTVGDGRVALVVHLLAPNKRAVQVTTDLEGFWDRHYPAVRKELMRKYPRHFWPEDPRNAPAMVRKPRKP